jgi:aspartate aminotransferase
MSIEVSKTVLNLQPSPTIHIFNVASQLKKEGKTIYNFGVGEMHPQFHPPDTFTEGTIQALKDHQTYYSDPQVFQPIYELTLNLGILELREALCEDFKANFGLHFKPTQVFNIPLIEFTLKDSLSSWTQGFDI